MNNLSVKKITDRQAMLGFSCFTKIGPKSMRLLEKYFSSPAAAYTASSFYLEKAGLKQITADNFVKWRDRFDLTAAEKKLMEEDINFITWREAGYPEILKEIAAPPFLLYYRGSLENLYGKNKNRLAIVGSRKHSDYAAKIITELVPDLTKRGIEIISGLALGVDSLAHRQTLISGGATIAVLGTGLDSKSIYPAINRRLAADIISQGGVVISEFPPHTPPLAQNFPQRNRIISGLAQATLIIEAKEKSGSLITADFALDQNREVLAVPGNIFSEFSGGTNNLIKSGAKVITEVEDIFETFKLETGKTAEKKRPIRKEVILNDDAEKLIYDVLRRANERGERVTIDEIAQISKLDTPVINSKLSILELRGIAKSDGISYDIT